jgi:uncharacterized cupredoxin-like copper-binding protein
VTTVAVALVASLAVLVAALPAFAKPTAKKAAAVAVTAGKPTEFGFKLSKKTVPHGSVTFTVTNGGALPHDFKICSSNKGGALNACAGKVTPMLTPGTKKTLTVTLTKPGTYEYLCAVSGHAAAGMKGLLKVT